MKTVSMHRCDFSEYHSLSQVGQSNNSFLGTDPEDVA